MVEDLEKNPATLGERENTVQRLIETNPATRALKEKNPKLKKKKSYAALLQEKYLPCSPAQKKKGFLHGLNLPTPQKPNNPPLITVSITSVCCLFSRDMYCNRIIRGGKALWKFVPCLHVITSEISPGQPFHSPAKVLSDSLPCQQEGKC